MKFGQFMSYSKGSNFIEKFYKKRRPENYFQALLCLQRIKDNLYWKIKFLTQSTCIIYVTGKLSKLVQINMLASWDSFLQIIS